ncbi:MAG TPA: hypothetical protein VMZ92_02755 [Planctomycetota bacterium]|nr:hypothetical protein [Planctomycetota bacterium]
MKRFCIALLAILCGAGPAFAQRMTVPQERERFEKLLEYARSSDPPSRHTAHEEMVKFNQWIDAELLGRIPGATIQERQLFWWVLYDRRCRKALGPALAMLPKAIERCRDAQIAVHELSELHGRMKQAERAGNNNLVDQLARQAAELRRQVPWNEVVQGDEVSVLCYIVSEFGHDDAFRQLVDIGIASSMDDALAKGLLTRRTRTHRDDPLPGGTELWNTVYRAVWEALHRMARRPMKKETREAMRAKLGTHFEKLKKERLGPNQEAAVENYHIVEGALAKTDKQRGEEDEKGEEETDDGVGIIKM